MKMAAIRAIPTALLIALLVQSTVGGQPSRDVGQLRRAIRTHIDSGRYVDAENEARALFLSLGALSSDNQLEVNPAADLLVEALARNGRAAEPDTSPCRGDVARPRRGLPVRGSSGRPDNHLFVARRVQDSQAFGR
jgi:hypothetical protein